MKLGSYTGCHQIAERSFFVRGCQLPVCARCTGAFIGELLSIALIAMGLRISLFAIALLLAVMGLDWLAQEMGIRESTNLRRLFTGICGGAGITFAFFYLLRFCYQTIINKQ